MKASLDSTKHYWVVDGNAAPLLLINKAHELIALVSEAMFEYMSMSMNYSKELDTIVSVVSN